MVYANVVVIVVVSSFVIGSDCANLRIGYGTFGAKSLGVCTFQSEKLSQFGFKMLFVFKLNMLAIHWFEPFKLSFK